MAGISPELERNLTNQAPVSPDIVARFEGLRVEAKILGGAIESLCPKSRERSLALTNLEQTLMWAIASIARNQEVLD